MTISLRTLYIGSTDIGQSLQIKEIPKSHEAQFRQNHLLTYALMYPIIENISASDPLTTKN